MYYWGKHGIQRDLRQAVKFYQMGAANGNPEGLFNLGITKLKVNISSYLSRTVLQNSFTRQEISMIMRKSNFSLIFFRERIKFWQLWQAILEQAPQYICHLFKPYCSIRSYRSSSQNLLFTLIFIHGTSGFRSFSVSSPVL